MTNRLYDKGRESFLKGEIAWQSDTIKAVLADAATYTPNLATDQFLSDVPEAARTATSPALTGKTTTAGVADADNTSFTAVTGPRSEFIVVFKDTGTASTSRLIALIDSATGLPTTPNGGDISMAWDDGANRIFKL